MIVYDVPLLVENNPTAEGFELVVVVQASVDTRLQRLAGRGMAEAGRPRADGPPGHRRAAAGRGRRAGRQRRRSLDELRAQVDRAWARMRQRARKGGPGLEPAERHPVEFIQRRAARKMSRVYTRT